MAPAQRALPPNPADLLGSPRMGGRCWTRSPGGRTCWCSIPRRWCPSPTAAVLSRRVDGVLLVVGAGTVKRDLARKAQAQLEAVKANVLGVVVVNLDFDAAAPLRAVLQNQKGHHLGGAASLIA